jgi:hypothetical protein
LNIRPIRKEDNNINTYVFILLIRNKENKSITKKDRADKWNKAAMIIHNIEYILEHIFSLPMHKEQA